MYRFRPLISVVTVVVLLLSFATAAIATSHTVDLSSDLKVERAEGNDGGKTVKADSLRVTGSVIVGTAKNGTDGADFAFRANDADIELDDLAIPTLAVGAYKSIEYLFGYPENEAEALKEMLLCSDLAEGGARQNTSVNKKRNKKLPFHKGSFLHIIIKPRGSKSDRPAPCQGRL